MDKPTLADLLGTKPFDTKAKGENACKSAIKKGTATGELGVDTRVVLVPNTRKYWVQSIEPDLRPASAAGTAPAPGPVEPEPAPAPSTTTEPVSTGLFGAKIEGGNANPKPVKLRTKRGPGTTRPRAQARVAGAADRLARVKAEAAGEVVPQRRTVKITLPPMAEGVTGPWLLVIEGMPEKADPRSWALEYSRKLKAPVRIISEQTNAFGCRIDAAALRPPRKGTPRTGGKLEGFAQIALELAARPAGVLRSELKERSERGMNFFGFLKRVGVQHGYKVTSDKSSGAPRYRAIKEAVAPTASD